MLLRFYEGIYSIKLHFCVGIYVYKLHFYEGIGTQTTSMAGSWYIITEGEARATHTVFQPKRDSLLTGDVKRLGDVVLLGLEPRTP